jgi:hypothetical protein
VVSAQGSRISDRPGFLLSGKSGSYRSAFRARPFPLARTVSSVQFAERTMRRGRRQLASAAVMWAAYLAVRSCAVERHILSTLSTPWSLNPPTGAFRASGVLTYVHECVMCMSVWPTCRDVKGTRQGWCGSTHALLLAHEPFRYCTVPRGCRWMPPGAQSRRRCGGCGLIAEDV